MSEIAALEERLQELHRRTAETPLFNPVFQLSLELSRQMEGGALDLDAAERLVAELECEGLRARAARLHNLLAPLDPKANLGALAGQATGDDFGAFANRWARPLAHVVFTAHPTFLLNTAQSATVARAATSGDLGAGTVCAASHTRDAITLDSEHEAAMAAMARAQGARDAINAALLAEARRRWPKRWRALNPLPFRFASWVGYDMDGRTDITWATSTRYRLEEKAMRLASYARMLAPHAPDLAEGLERARTHAAALAARFAQPLDAPAALAEAANALTAPHPDKLTSLTAVIAAIEARAVEAEDRVGEALLVVAAAMRADGLGMGWVHFRVNSSQLQNAIRRRIDPDGTLDLASQAATVRMRELLAEAQPLRANFAALAIETSTAIRQFLIMAQILHHIDADSPIRMLVAECEQPTTVLAALYPARKAARLRPVDALRAT